MHLPVQGQTSKRRPFAPCASQPGECLSPVPSPLRLPAGPSELQAYLASLQEALSAVTPRLRTLFEKPGANELLADLQWGLLQRFAARSIKFVLGAQAQPGQQAQQVPATAEAAAQGQRREAMASAAGMAAGGRRSVIT